MANHITTEAVDEWIKTSVEEITEDLQEGEDVYDRSHEYVDGCEWILESKKALQLLCTLTIEEIDEAYAEFGAHSDTWTGIVTSAAYGALRRKLDTKLVEATHVE